MSTSNKRDSSRNVVLFALFHVVCCGLPLLLISGVSLAFLTPYWPVAAGILTFLGVIGFAWYLRRGCSTCPPNEEDRAVRPNAASKIPTA